MSSLHVRRSLPLALGGLVWALACRPPVAPPAPSWELAVAQAAEASAPPEGDPVARREHLEGFRHGVTMVANALRESRVPYRIRIGGASRAPLPRGPMPLGVQVEAPPPEVEMDPETGLPWATAMGGDGPWAQGAVRGFTWAMERKAEALRALGALRPRPVPSPPSEGAWVAWPTSEGFTTVELPSVRYTLARQGGLLFWTASGRGFAPVRTWCALQGQRVERTAAQEDCLWVQVATGHAVALDRDTGFVRAVVAGRPAPPPRPAEPAAKGEEPAGRPVPRKAADGMAWWSNAETLQEFRLRAEAGDPYGMLGYAMALVRRKPEEGLAWLRKAADCGYARAMVHLGCAFLEGQYGLRPDRAEARRWLEKAAAAGDAEARAALAALFQPGEPVTNP